MYNNLQRYEKNTKTTSFMFKFPEFVGFSCRWDGNFRLCGVEKVVVVGVIVCL
jgi:hypothetical protein